MPNEDELEFATKEDLEEIAKDPRLTKIYNALKAGVTKKFQSYAAEKKQLTEIANDLDTKVGEWEDWYTSNYPNGWQPPDNAGRTANTGGGTDKGGSRKKGSEVSYEELVQAIDTFQNRMWQAAQEYDKKLAEMGKMLDLSMQLGDLYRGHPDIDGKKVLKTAIDKGYASLDDAYNVAYRDEILNKEVDKRLSTRMEEEKKKMESEKMETGANVLPTHFELPKEAPKSFSEAAKETLKEIGAGTLNK